MTIEEKRQKLKEHCNRMTDCNDCELGGYVTSSCWRYGSDGVIEELSEEGEKEDEKRTEC